MNSVYRVMGASGQLNIPKNILDKCGIEVGDVVKVEVMQNAIVVYKVGIVDNSNATPQEAMGIAENAILSLEKENQLELLKKLAETIKGEE